jgi:hypothetical protein
LGYEIGILYQGFWINLFRILDAGTSWILIRILID